MQAFTQFVASFAETAHRYAKKMGKAPNGRVTLFGIPKNGTIVASMMVAAHPGKFSQEFDESLIDPETTVVVDDILDTGRTMAKYKDFARAVLYRKPYSPEDGTFAYTTAEGWVDIPFEKEKPVEDHIVRIIQKIGDDPTREGLRDTPRRVVKSWKELFAGYGKKAEDVMTVFENEAEVDQIVGLSGIEYYSTCEHHMIPFFGTAHVYYIPGKKLCGISKLARILDIHARRLQNQERIAKAVADDIVRLLDPKGVAVVLDARHLCMCARGAGKQHASMKTSDLRGLFRRDSMARQELYSLIK